MHPKLRQRGLLAAGGLAIVAGLVAFSNHHPTFEPTQPETEWSLPFELPLSSWQRQQPELDPQIEQRIDALLSQMTLAQKVGQMTQGEIKHVTAADVERYGLGSVLSGGGSWPTESLLHYTVDDWLQLADSYWLASQQTEHQIPIMWGIDAVHGHNNMRGATMFPHNIGLGAANDVELIERIAQVTAAQVRATGQDWTFAPNLAVGQNPRWGRFYESFGQTPEQIYHYSKAAVSGLQDGFSDQGIIATAKHFVGDGGTANGKEKGQMRVSEDTLRNVHSLGYFGALDADVQVVMAGFNSWWMSPMTSHQHMITEVLKQQMGFDGFVITDWNALELVPGCKAYSCPEAINAGIDMVMVPKQWREFIEHTVAQVERGEIAPARIDDAVRRILRVKLRSGLFERERPSARPMAGDTQLLASEQTRSLARQAVRQSLVMLKNNDQILPLNKTGNYLVLGSANSLTRQSGGWSLKWQGGQGFSNEDYGTGQTIVDGIRELLAPHGGSAASIAKHDESYDAAIVVLSERPYAETEGDIWIRYSTAIDQQLAAAGLKELNDLRERYPELPLVVVYLGGRPLWMNPQLNQSDAFVAAWLPGSEGGGVADGLFGDYAIDGKLPVNWPADDCYANPAAERNALFPIGYGLTFGDDTQLPQLPERRATLTGSKQVAFGCIFSNAWLSPLK